MGIIISLIISAIMAGTVVYLAFKLTIDVLKAYKKKKDTKIITAYLKDVFKAAPKKKLDDLDDDDVILAEYDEDNDELVQEINIAKDVGDKVKGILDDNDGMVVFE